MLDIIKLATWIHNHRLFQDEADTQESEIDKRLGLGVSSISDRPLPHPTLGELL